MGKDSSFDIVSEVDLQEIDNAVQQAKKELLQRYDFKGSKSEVNFSKEEKKIKIIADDEMKLKSLKDILDTKLTKRDVSLKAIKYGVEEQGIGGAIKQEAEILLGIPKENAKDIVKIIKGMKLKVQASIQGEQIRVSSKKRDDLQSIINHLKETPVDIPLQFTNYR